MGAPVSAAKRCCGLLQKTPDLQTDNAIVWVCECVGATGRCRIMETVTRGR